MLLKLITDSSREHSILLCNIDTPTIAKPFYFVKIRLINTGPRVIRIPILSKSDTMPVLNIFKILTNLDEYIIAIGGVVDGMALDIEAANAAAIMGGMGLNPAPTARDAATGHITTAELYWRQHMTSQNPL